MLEENEYPGNVTKSSAHHCVSFVLLQFYTTQAGAAKPDFDFFQLRHSGESIPADPNCVD
jgi:hypothetical protein